MSVTHEQKYNTYVDLYKHYSGLMFKARISVITVIFAAYGYMLGIVGGDNGNFPIEYIKILTPICASSIMAGIFLLEVSYYTNFFKAVRSIKNIENLYSIPGEIPFFNCYSRRNWHFCILYFAASVLFTVICIYNIYYYRHDLSWIEICVAAPFSIFPITSLFRVWTFLNHNYFYIVSGKNVRGLLLLKISATISQTRTEKLLKQAPDVNEFREKTEPPVS